MEGGEIGELQDWEEVGLHSAGEEEEDKDGHVGHGSFSSIEAAAEGMIKHDYFSLDNQARFSYAKSEAGSVESDNPSWIDPVSVSVYKDSGGFWSDSASDRSDDRKSYDFEAKAELGIAGIEEREALMEHVDENLAESEAGSREIGRLESSVSVELEANKELEDEEGAVEEVKVGGEDEREKRMVLWWKVPLEMFKYCVFKVSPVWSFSVAAAVMGLVILGRRLYRMKRRSRSLQLKVALDDKKVSQFMNRAVRLNEAFSVVRRVPVLRPSLSAAGDNPWPMTSLR